MIFAAKPVPCQLRVQIELLADVDGGITDAMPLRSVTVQIPDYRATEQVTDADFYGALRAMARQFREQDHWQPIETAPGEVT